MLYASLTDEQRRRAVKDKQPHGLQFMRWVLRIDAVLDPAEELFNFPGADLSFGELYRLYIP